MAEMLIQGPQGRIEARYTPPPYEGASIALILHPHPRAGGTMQDPITIRLYQMFEEKGFGVLRFNTRGVGRSQGVYDQGVGELEDAAFVLDYMENLTESPRYVWCAGYSFGAWITLQLLMRRPEIDGFLAIARVDFARIRILRSISRICRFTCRSSLASGRRHSRARSGMRSS